LTFEVFVFLFELFFLMFKIFVFFLVFRYELLDCFGLPRVVDSIVTDILFHPFLLVHNLNINLLIS
jgi:hypothetical protein